MKNENRNDFSGVGVYIIGKKIKRSEYMNRMSNLYNIVQDVEFYGIHNGFY